MKHFIYMDMDILNSYLSQIHDGLVTSSKNETTDQTSEQESENSTPIIKQKELQIGLSNLIKTTFKTNKDFIITTRTLNQLESGKELIEKMMHDNAFENFKKYLIKKNLLKTDEELRVGDYIITNDRFSIWDLDYLVNVFDETMINFIVKFTEADLKRKLDEEKEKFNREQLRSNSNEIRQFEKEIKTTIEKTKEEYNDYAVIFKKFSEILPSDNFLIVGDYFIPLNKKFLRDSVKSIRFKYTGNITLVGKITNNFKNVVSTNKEPNLSDIFATIDQMLGGFYGSLLPNTENMKIVTPIALYFE